MLGPPTSEVAAAEGAVPQPLTTLTGFGRYLRGNGLAVGTGRILTFYRAVFALDSAERSSLYWAGRTTLIGRKEDLALYDRLFDLYFGGARESRAPDEIEPRDQARPPDERETPAVAPEIMRAPADGEDASDEPEEKAAVRLVSSSAEVLRTKSFEKLSDEERRLVALLIRRLSVEIPVRPSRRHRPSNKRGALDMRRTLRASLRTEGEPFRRAWRRRATKSRPVVLILDVSGSMSAYSRALMQFGFALMATGHRVEVFCFGTRLTRVTRSLRTRDPNHALRHLAATVRDWEGGTRIGASLKQLLDTHGQHVALRGSIVVLCSDGLERGDPQVLEAQMARLGRLAHRIVWVNPLKGSAAYQPLARGMAAALPHIDVFMAGHNFASLEALARILEE